MSPEEPLPELRIGDDWTDVVERGMVRLGAPAYEPVLTRGVVILGNVLAVLPLLTILGALLLLFVLFGDATPQSWDKIVRSLTPAKVVGLCVCGALILYTVAAIFDLSGSANRMLERAARRIIGRRRDRYVDPDSKEARFVELVPRENWHRPMLETATDVGFLHVDPSRGVVLFEGGGERWAVRGADIAGCQVETLVVGFQLFHFVVIEIRNAALGVRERCIANRHSGMVLLGLFGRRWAQALATSIDQLRLQTPSVD